MGLTADWILQKKKKINAFVNMAIETIRIEAQEEKQNQKVKHLLHNTRRYNYK